MARQPLTDWLARRLINTGFVTNLIDSRIAQTTPSKAGFLYAGEIPTGHLSGVRSFQDYTLMEFDKLQVSNYAVWRNIQLIARTVAQGLMEIEQADPESEEGWLGVEGHPFEKIIESRPNPFMGQQEIWEAQISWLLLRGEAYWLTVLNGADEIVQLFPLPANRVEPIPHPTEYISGYAYYPVNNKDPEIIPKERICYHKLFNPFSMHRGLAPLTAFLMGLQINREAQSTALEDYTRRLKLEHILSAPQETTEPDMSQIVYDLEVAQNRGDRFHVIRGGDLSVSAVQKMAEENPEIIFKLTETQINSAFGVNDSVWNETSNRATAEVHDAGFIGRVIWPLMLRVAEDVTIQLVQPEYGLEYRAYFKDPRPINQAAEITERDDSRKDQTYGEVRIAAGLEAHSDERVNVAPHSIAGEVYRMIIEAELTGVVGGGLADPGSIDPSNVESPEDISAGLVEELEESGEDVPGVGETEAEVEGDEDKSLKVEFMFEDDHPDELFDYESELSLLIANANPGNRETFITSVHELIDATFPALILEGAEASSLDDLSDEATAELESSIRLAKDGVGSLYDDAIAGKLPDEDEEVKAPRIINKLKSRVAKWLSFAAGLFEKGKTYDPTNPVLRWERGNTKEPCSDCLGFDGQEKTAREWRGTGFAPKASNLECGGFNCDCRYVRVRQERSVPMNGSGEKVSV